MAAADYGFARVRRRHDAHRGRIDRLRRRRDPGRQPRPAARRLGRALRAGLVAVRRDARGRARRRRLRRRASTPCCTRAGSITDDIEHVPGGKTFFWAGRYHRDINRATRCRPTSTCSRTSSRSCRRPRARRTSCSWPTSSPTCSARCASSASAARFVAMDSMNLWIDIAHDVAAADDRAGRLPDPQRRRAQAADGRAQPGRAPRARRSTWARGVVIAKQGEYGSAMFTRDGFFGLSAFPPADVVDPTGAGDTFAGGLVGYLAAHARRDRRRRCCAARWPTGPRCASFNVEELRRGASCTTLGGAEIDARVAALARLEARF